MKITTTRFTRKKWSNLIAEAKAGTTYDPASTSVGACASIHPRYSGGFRERNCAVIVPVFKDPRGGDGAKPFTEEMRAIQVRAESNRAPGYCSCGCGSRTGVAKKDDPVGGRKAGESAKWMPGHMMSYMRRNKHGLAADSVSRVKERDDFKKELDEFLYRNRFATRDDVYDHFQKKGFRQSAIGVMLRTVVRGYGYNEDEIEMPKRRPRPVALPPYERKHIPYERETELPLLTSIRLFASLDDVHFGTDRSRHETTTIRTHDWHTPVAMSPLDALMAKEDAEERRKEMWPLIDQREEVLPEGFGFSSIL